MLITLITILNTMLITFIIVNVKTMCVICFIVHKTCLPFVPINSHMYFSVSYSIMTSYEMWWRRTAITSLSSDFLGCFISVCINHRKQKCLFGFFFCILFNVFVSFSTSHIDNRKHDTYSANFTTLLFRKRMQPENIQNTNFMF